MEQYWVVAETQFEPEVSPAVTQQVPALWLRLVSKAQAMGLLSQQLGYELNERSLRAVLDAFRRHGLLRARLAVLGELKLSNGSVPQPLAAAAALKAAIEVLEESPAPKTEWQTLGVVLGESMLASLVGVSVSSVKRYSKAEREASDEIADRLHFLAMVVADLAGSYNELGIRRWFDRPRAQLSGKSPRAALGENWQSSTPPAQDVRLLAANLVSGGAT